MRDDSPDKIAARLIELLGGREKASEILDRSYEEEVRLWEQPTGAIGRILRAHLYLEYHLTKYLQVSNPRLPDLSRARLSFAQKLALVNESDKQVWHLISGVRQINSIRNRMGHRINARIEPGDTEVLHENQLFVSLRNALARPYAPSGDPVDIVEDFSKFAGTWLRNAVDPLKHVWAEALKSVEGEELIG